MKKIQVGAVLHLNLLVNEKRDITLSKRKTLSVDDSKPTSARVNYLYSLNVLQTYIVAHGIDIQGSLDKVTKMRSEQINTVIFTRFNNMINSPLKSIEQIQLFNVIRRKFGLKVSRSNLIDVLTGKESLKEN